MTAIRSIAHALPEREVTNADLARENPSWDMDRVFARTGVRARRVTAPDETALDLSVTACQALVERSGLALDSIDALLYCTQSPDYPMPGNAHVLHGHLGLGDRVMAFDYNLGCSGYVYGLAISDALVRAGLVSEVLLVTSGTYTKHVNPRDRSTRVVLGDGAAVTHVSGTDDDGGRIAAAELRSNGSVLEKVFIPGGGARAPQGEDSGREVVDGSGNVRTALDMHMDGPAVWAFANSVLPDHVREFLASRSLGLDDVDLFVFHQASKMVLDSMTRALKVPAAKVYVCLEDVGNLSAASIPYALRAALDEGAIGPGARVLLSALGAGMSYGSVLVEF
jgi:3-oxoacyl-[acyl-carrier-protein] synthase-3